MQEIIDEFVVETLENLDRLDSLFVTLENDPQNVDILANIFRDVHTIKGTSGFLGFSKLEGVAHVGENLLSKLRDGDLVLNTYRTTVLLHMVDAIREIITAIEQTQGEGSGNYDHLVAELSRALTDAGDQYENVLATPTADPSVAPVEASEPEAAALAERGHPDDSDPVLVAHDDALTNEPADVVESLAPVMADTPAQEGVEQEKSVETTPHVEHKGGRSAAESSIRVDVDLLDDLMNLVGELVLARNQILQYQIDTQDASLQDTSQRLNLITSELQEGVMKTRMQPIGNVFSKFPRVVRDIARDLGKQVDIVMEGRDTELDKTIIEAIKDCTCAAT